MQRTLRRKAVLLPEFRQFARSTRCSQLTYKRAPEVLFCLMSALRVHELTTQAPFEVWIAIGNKDYPPRMDYPPLRVVRCSQASLEAGVERRKVDGTHVRVTSVAKTVADCFKFRNKIGLDVALEALREARRTKKVSSDDLWRFAKIDRVANVMRPIWKPYRDHGTVSVVGSNLPGAPKIKDLRQTRHGQSRRVSMAENTRSQRSLSRASVTPGCAHQASRRSPTLVAPPLAVP